VAEIDAAQKARPDTNPWTSDLFGSNDIRIRRAGLIERLQDNLRVDRRVQCAVWPLNGRVALNLSIVRRLKWIDLELVVTESVANAWEETGGHLAHFVPCR
jgi:hypothetical protein